MTRPFCSKYLFTFRFHLMLKLAVVILWLLSLIKLPILYSDTVSRVFGFMLRSPYLDSRKVGHAWHLKRHKRIQWPINIYFRTHFHSPTSYEAPSILNAITTSHQSLILKLSVVKRHINVNLMFIENQIRLKWKKKCWHQIFVDRNSWITGKDVHGDY